MNEPGHDPSFGGTHTDMIIRELKIVRTGRIFSLSWQASSLAAGIIKIKIING